LTFNELHGVISRKAELFNANILFTFLVPTSWSLLLDEHCHQFPLLLFWLWLLPYWKRTWTHSHLDGW
jgi:hypothetical protein